MEDSESLVRLYKRKKAEVEHLRDHSLSLETELGQLKQIIESYTEEIQRSEMLQQTAD